MDRACKIKEKWWSLWNLTIFFSYLNLDDQSGYISDGPSHKYSIYKKSATTNLDKNKSSSAKGLRSIFGR